MNQEKVKGAHTHTHKQKKNREQEDNAMKIPRPVIMREKEEIN